MKNFYFALLLTFFIGATVPAASYGGNVNRFVLSNGLNVIHKQVSDNPIVTIQLFLKSGAASETEVIAGISNLTQIVMLKSTNKRSNEQLSIDLENIGANISEESGHDFASVSISSVKSHIGDAAEILTDVVTNPAFDEAEISKEKSNVLAGIKSRHDSIHQTADDLFLETFYKGHPYSWPDVGTKKSVEKFAKSDLLNWHKSHFTVSNIFVVIAGDISLDDARQLLEKYLSKIAGTGKMIKPSKAAKTHLKKISEKTKKFQQAYYMMGFPAPGINENPKDFAALKLLNAYLGGRMSGKLFVELRDKLSLAYEVNSFYQTRKGVSRFVIYLGLKKENVKLAGKRIMEIIKEIKANGVLEKDLNETKSYVKGVYLLDHQTVSRQSWYLGWWEVYDRGCEYDDTYMKDVAAVTTADVKRVAEKYFTDDFMEVEIVPE